MTDLNISLHQPLYVYQKPMFELTVSVVLIVDNGVLVVRDSERNDIYTYPDDLHRLPGGSVKAGQETIQFAAVRHIKEQVGIVLTKEALIPVDFRSDPARSKEGNVVDIGFYCIVEKPIQINDLPQEVKWKEMDFERKKTVENIKLHMDHETLLERAVELMSIMK